MKFNMLTLFTHWHFYSFPIETGRLVNLQALWMIFLWVSTGFKSKELTHSDLMLQMVAVWDRVAAALKVTQTFPYGIYRGQHYKTGCDTNHRHWGHCSATLCSLLIFSWAGGDSKKNSEPWDPLISRSKGTVSNRKRAPSPWWEFRNIIWEKKPGQHLYSRVGNPQLCVWKYSRVKRFRRPPCKTCPWAMKAMRKPRTAMFLQSQFSRVSFHLSAS